MSENQIRIHRVVNGLPKVIDLNAKTQLSRRIPPESTTDEHG
jgi:hypothetical protein